MRNVTHERYITHDDRSRGFYGSYYNSPAPVQHYSDPFGPFFYMWLFDKASSNDRAQWAYNHRSEISDDRWKDMVSKDAALEARVKQLEAEKAPRDVKYVPTEMKGNEDLMYSEEFVKAAYNEEPTKRELLQNVVETRKAEESAWHKVWTIFKHMLIITAIVAIPVTVFVMFIDLKDWNQNK